MKFFRFFLMTLAALVSLALIMPLTGCSLLGIGNSEEDSIGTISSLDGPVDKRICRESLRIVDNLKETSYQTEPVVSESKGTYRFDAASLVNYVLGRVAPDNYARLTHGVDGTLRPSHYYNYFMGLNGSTKAPVGGWSRIVSLANARPGDIIVITHKQQEGNPAGGSDHVLIIVDTPAPADNIGYSVLVVDAALSGHDRDTREADGVGKGLMYFGLNESGAPRNYRWSDPLGPSISRDIIGIAIGRPG